MVTTVLYEHVFKGRQSLLKAIMNTKPVKCATGHWRCLMEHHLSSYLYNNTCHICTYEHEHNMH